MGLAVVMMMLMMMTRLWRQEHAFVGDVRRLCDWVVEQPALWLPTKAHQGLPLMLP